MKIIYYFFFILLSSCSNDSKLSLKLNEDKVARENLLQLEHEMAAIYRRGNVFEAETALLTFRKRLITLKNDQVRGLDYNALLGQTSARLYAIYSVTDRTNEAQWFLKDAMTNLTINMRQSRTNNRDSNKEDIHDFLLRVDKPKVMWMQTNSLLQSLLK